VTTPSLAIARSTHPQCSIVALDASAIGGPEQQRRAAVIPVICQGRVGLFR
jgi:hypothetical protein